MDIRSTTGGLLLPKLDSAAMMNLRDIDGMWFYSTYFETGGYWGGGQFKTDFPKKQEFIAQPFDTVEIFLDISTLSVEFLEENSWVQKSSKECINYSYSPDTMQLEEDSLKVVFSENYVYLQADTNSIIPDGSDNFIFEGSWMDLGIAHGDRLDTKFWVKSTRTCDEYKRNYTLVRDSFGENPFPEFEPGKTYFINNNKINTVLITYY